MLAMRAQYESVPPPRLPPVRPSPPGAGRVLERRPQPGGGFAWSIEPYGGCEAGCATCLARQAESGPEALRSGGSALPRIAGVDALCAQLRDVAARRDRAFADRPVLLGYTCDPWQPAERELGLTRKILEALAVLPGVDLRCATRSSLVGRDLDLLAQLARRGRVQVSVAFPGADRRAWTALEPEAPSPERRLMAVGLVARAGVAVGVRLEPVLRAFNDQDEAWTRLLSRAKEAGARFAEVRPLALSDAGRERLFEHVQAHAPERAGVLRRVLSRAHLHDPRSGSVVEARFASVCREVGLAFEGGTSPEVAPAPRQLSLF